MHVTARLYHEEHDFLVRHGEPWLQYMIATNPRSGSTYFAMELWRTGVLGAPMEYANPSYIHLWNKYRGTEGADIVAYWREVRRRRTSPNGVFGYKMFIGNYLQSEESHPALLREIVPDKVIYLTRRDVVGQAISLSRAVQSSAWFHGATSLKEPKYDYEGIRKYVDQIEQELAVWKSIFDVAGATVHPVLYEDLVDHPVEVLENVCQFLGVDKPLHDLVDLPVIRIQRSSESNAWKERFASDQARAT